MNSALYSAWLKRLRTRRVAVSALLLGGLLLAAIAAVYADRPAALRLLAALGIAAGVAAWLTRTAAYRRAGGALLSAVAAQAARRGARLSDETQTVSAELQELVASSREFGATLDISALAESVVQRLHRATAAPVALFEWNPENATLHRLAHFPANAADPARRLLETQHAALAALLASPRPASLDLNREAALPSIMALPLVARERPVGLAVMWPSASAASAPGARRLVEGIIHQAAVALQNAQAYSRADASLRERVIELSAIEVISRHMSATLDLETIINDVLAAAMSAIDAALGCCALVLDDERLMLVAMLEQGGAQIELPAVRPVSQGLARRVLQSHQPALAGDVLADPAYVPLFEGMRSELCVPIRRDGRTVGLLDFADPRANAFTASQMRFVSTLAEHAAIAIENARLFNDRRRQIETLVSLRRISSELLAATRLETVADIVIRCARESLHAARADLYWIEVGQRAGTTSDARAGGERLVCAGVDGRVADAFVREAAQSGEPRYSVDASTLPPYQALMPLRAFAARACVPIRRGDHVLGVVDVEITDSRYYTPSEVQALEVMAAQAAVAVESISLNNAVRAGRDQLQAILDSAREGILLFDLSGRLLQSNPAAEEMLEQPLAAIQGRSYLDWLRAQRPARLLALTGHTPAGLRRYRSDVMRDPRRVVHRQFTQQREAGTRTIDEIGTPVLDEHGEQVIGWMLVWHDITEERRLNDLRQELSSMIVHDLRSPLTAMISSLTLLDELLAEEPVDRATAHDVIRLAAASSESMLRLVESLLDIARLEQHRVALDRAAYPLRDVVDSAYVSVLSLALEAGITIETHLPADLPLLWIDGEQIHRVLVNLLDNALRHTPTGGRVSVEAALSEAGEAVCISVCDSGPGIPPHERAVIFEKFSQLDHPVLRGHKGSGLGLTFCKLVVEAHDGRIWVDDAPLGGAAFHIRLPAAEGRAVRAQTAQDWLPGSAL